MQGIIDTSKYMKFLREFGEYIQVWASNRYAEYNTCFEFQFGYMYWRYF